MDFQSFLDSVTDLSVMHQDGDEEPKHTHTDDLSSYERLVEFTARRLQSLPQVTREALSDLIREEPGAVPILATCVGLTQERLKNQLKHRLGTSGWTVIARKDPMKLIQVLDESFDLVQRVEQEKSRAWTYADVFLERYKWSRKTAGSAIQRGRGLEDEVERIVRNMGLAYEMRTRFQGRGGVGVPCDIAIPSSADALIVGAAKGFNSTGSKLTDAVREIENMAQYRHARQFVFALVDGIGWKSRASDLRRIYELWQSREIDGLYTLSLLDQLRNDLTAAAVRHDLIPPR